MTLEKILYTARAHTSSGRDGGDAALVEAAHQVCPYSHVV